VKSVRQRLLLTGSVFVALLWGCADPAVDEAPAPHNDAATAADDGKDDRAGGRQDAGREPLAEVDYIADAWTRPAAPDVGPPPEVCSEQELFAGWAMMPGLHRCSADCDAFGDCCSRVLSEVFYGSVETERGVRAILGEGAVQEHRDAIEALDGGDMVVLTFLCDCPIGSFLDEEGLHQPCLDKADERTGEIEVWFTQTCGSSRRGGRPYAAARLPATIPVPAVQGGVDRCWDAVPTGDSR
jgi:hypothetical protein